MGGGPGRQGRSGFTLVELIVVLLLAAGLVALVLPSLTGTLDSARLRGGASEVRATLALARSLAAHGGRARTVVIDLDRGEYGVSGERGKRALPEGVRFSLVRVGERESREGQASIRFLPDGSSGEAEIRLLSAGEAGFRVRVDPLTGIAFAEAG